MPTPENTTTQDTNTTTETTNQVGENTGGQDGVKLGDMSLDDFMSMDFSNDPKLQETFSQEHKGLPDYKTILMKHSTEEGRKLIANMRSSYTKKTQELSEARKQLEMERAQMIREKEALYNSEYTKRLKTVAESTEELDPYTPEGLSKIIERETAKRMQEMLKPQQDAISEQRAIMAAERFVNEHPEMRTEAFKAKLVPLMTDRQDLDLETAYWMVKGQLSKEAEAKQVEDKKAAQTKKAETREAIKKTAGTTTVSGSTPPKGLTPYEAMQWIKANKK